MENSGQRYASVVDSPPPMRHPDDELIEVQLDSVVAEKLALLWQWRKLLQKYLLWGVVLSLVLAFVIPKTYESTVRLMPPDSGGAGGLMNLLMGGAGGAASGQSTSAALGMAATALGMKSSADLYLDVLTGPSVLDPIINHFDLRHEYGVKYYEDARKLLIQHTTVDENRKSGVVSITVNARRPEIAQQMAQAYADQLATVLRSVSNSSARRERIFLENRLKVVKAEMDESARQMADFATKNTAIDIPEQAKATLTAAGRGQGELVAAEAQLEGLRQIYTDDNSRVRELRARIAELRRQVDVEQKGDSGPNSMMHWIRALPKLGVEWSEFYRKATINVAVFTVLTQQYEFAKVQEAKETTSVSVLDPPQWPERKATPKRSYVLLLGVLFSFMLGAAHIIVRDSFQGWPDDHPGKLYILAAMERWSARWHNSRLGTKLAQRRLKQRNDDGLS